MMIRCTPITAENVGVIRFTRSKKSGLTKGFEDCKDIEEETKTSFNRH